MKACYGTTKYCNAFLKGLPCNNVECLYLHDVGKDPHDKLSPNVHALGKVSRAPCLTSKEGTSHHTTIIAPSPGDCVC